MADDNLPWWDDQAQVDYWRTAIVRQMATPDIIEVPRRAGRLETLEAQIVMLTEAIRVATSA